jgi:hypothetical protein
VGVGEPNHSALAAAPGSGGEVTALYVPDGHGGDRHDRDSGAPGSTTKLQARGKRICRLKDGHPTATTLRCGHPTDARRTPAHWRVTPHAPAICSLDPPV